MGRGGVGTKGRGGDEGRGLEFQGEGEQQDRGGHAHIGGVGRERIEERAVLEGDSRGEAGGHQRSGGGRGGAGEEKCGVQRPERGSVPRRGSHARGGGRRCIQRRRGRGREGGILLRRRARPTIRRHPRDVPVPSSSDPLPPILHPRPTPSASSIRRDRFGSVRLRQSLSRRGVSIGTPRGVVGRDVHGHGGVGRISSRDVLRTVRGEHADAAGGISAGIGIEDIDQGLRVDGGKVRSDREAGVERGDGVLCADIFGGVRR
mmetsp:Transcript_62071/g.183421  ORF Transcript_62071/g.183421 Transcript_62071/m.183421 type:complete len:261 (+) Transcript_62071:299-1081(+)